MMQHFRRLGVVDTAAATELLPALARYWPRNRLRQSAPGTPHRDTESIYLLMPDVVNAETIFTAMDIVLWSPMPQPVLASLIERVAHVAKAEPARVMLVKLLAGGVIHPHIDQGPYAEATQRYHVALVSNPHCVMHIDDEAATARPGEVWWFNKHALHAVVNGGDEDRVHLIVDCWR